jgi:hypothetical protein
MAKIAGISLRSVQRIWDAHQLQPHRVRSFKRSRDQRFAEKMADIVGLYLGPPAHTMVLSIDEKSQIQALDRTHHLVANADWSDEAVLTCARERQTRSMPVYWLPNGHTYRVFSCPERSSFPDPGHVVTKPGRQLP